MASTTSTTRTLAAEFIDELIDNMGDESMPDEVRSLAGTLRRWRDQILAWHTAQVTNGPTEGMNNLIKRVKRVGFGFRRFAHYRIRVLLYAGRPNWALLASSHTPLKSEEPAFCGAVVFILYFQSSVLFSTLAPLPLAYLLLWLGGVLPTRVGAKNDISYGVYIYAFPVQQLLALAGVQRFGVIPMMVASTICTIPLAWSSWVLVERPAMRLKGWRSAPRVAAAI